MALFTTWWPIIGLALMRPLGAMLLMPVFGTSVLGIDGKLAGPALV